jgi:hypothetical protein
VGDLPAFGFFHLPRGVPQSLLLEAYRSQMQVASVLNCWTSRLDISGYHADFHEGHGTVGAGQRRSMTCVNNAARHGRGTVWVRHGHGMLCVN